LILAPVLYFLTGFLFGYMMGRILLPGTRIIFGILMWLPVVAILLQRFGVVEVAAFDELSLLFLAMPRVIKLPAIGFLVGYTIRTLLGVARRESGFR
jgi:hypothetical protein